MNIKSFALLFLTGLMLSGCDKQTSTKNCSSQDTQRLISNLLVEQAEKLTALKNYEGYEGTFAFGISKIRESLAQDHVSIDNVRVIKKDPNSSKEFCRGQLKVTIPSNTLADIDQARERQHQSKIAQYAKQFNIGNSNNVFTQDVEYRVQPATDGKAPYIEFESAAWVKLLDEITTSALLKPILKAQGTALVQKNEHAVPASQAKLEDKAPITPQEKQDLEISKKASIETKPAKKELSQAPRQAKRSASKDAKPKEIVTAEELEIRNGLAYMPNEDKPFTGKHEEYHQIPKKKTELKDGKQNESSPTGDEHKKKYIEITYKDGKKNGPLIMWDENGNKIGEINYSNGERVE